MGESLATGIKVLLAVKSNFEDATNPPVLTYKVNIPAVMSFTIFVPICLSMCFKLTKVDACSEIRVLAQVYTKPIVQTQVHSATVMPG